MSGIAWNFAQAVVQLQTSNYWQYVQGYGTSQVALGQLVMLVMFAIGGVIAGRMMRPGARTMYLMGFGFLGLALPMIAFGFITTTTPYWMMGIALFIMGFGLAFVSVPQSALFVAEAKPEYFGPVTAFRTTAGQLGYALGFAVSTALVNTYGRLDLIEKLRDAGVAPSQIGDAVSQVVLFMRTGQSDGSAEALAGISKLGEAYSGGFAAALVISGFTVLFLAAITMLLLIIGMRQGKRDLHAVDPDAQPESESDSETEKSPASQATEAAASP